MVRGSEPCVRPGSSQQADVCDPPAAFLADERDEDDAAFGVRGAAGAYYPVELAERALGRAADDADHAGADGDGLVVLEDAAERGGGLAGAEGAGPPAVQVEGDARRGDEGRDAAGIAAGPGLREACNGALERGLLGVGGERGPEQEGQRREGRAAHHARASAAAMSADTRASTAMGSGAARMDRPPTR